MSPRDVIYEEMGEECPEPDVCQHCLKRADSIIAALAKAGFKILPREPSDAVLAVAQRKELNWLNPSDVYRAMWDAASPSTGDHG